MFVGSPTNIRATWGRHGWLGLPCVSYVHRGTEEHKANVALGWLLDYMAYVHRSGETDEHKSLRFVQRIGGLIFICLRSSLMFVGYPMNITYVRRL
jgi:hypothetical protein